ncbi:hypothetical protein Droror1_Dr00003080 [Drosera rotundifolia]
MVPTWLKDVAQLLMPKCAPPLEMASLGWMGDWRPTSILKRHMVTKRGQPCRIHKLWEVRECGVLAFGYHSGGNYVAVWDAGVKGKHKLLEVVLFNSKRKVPRFITVLVS